MKALIMTAIILSSCGTRLSQPAGSAHYSVDTGRSSKMIRSGEADASIVDANAVTIKLAWDLRTWVGHERGDRTQTVSPQFWTDQFWNTLRVTKHWEQGTTHVDHLGYRDVLGIAHCDYVRLYDTTAPDNDLYASMDIKRVPALGAVQLDATAKYAGQTVKLGLDWER